MELTDKQRQLLDYLMERMDEEGRIPTLRQAAVDLGVSHTAVAQLMNQLEKKNVLEREGYYGRTVCLYPRPRQSRSAGTGRELPIVGRVTAGLPMYAQQEWEGTVVVDSSVFPGDNLFCLRIKGRSMQDAGILDGDLVVCEPRQYAENGEIVAKASTENEEILSHDLDCTLVEDFRRIWPFFRDRRIDAYGDLTQRWRS